MFESRGIGGVLDTDWLSRPFAAWVPIVLGDVWKSTPFVALLLLAGLQSIDASLYEAARIDGAGRWRRFTQITLPQLVPAITVALRVQDDGRVPRVRSRLCADRRRTGDSDGGRSRSMPLRRFCRTCDSATARRCRSSRSCSRSCSRWSTCDCFARRRPTREPCRPLQHGGGRAAARGLGLPFVVDAPLVDHA